MEAMIRGNTFRCVMYMMSDSDFLFIRYDVDAEEQMQINSRKTNSRNPWSISFFFFFSFFFVILAN